MSDDKGKAYDVESAAAEPNDNFDRSWRDEAWGNRKLSVAAEDTAHDEKNMTVCAIVPVSLPADGRRASKP